MNPLVSNNQALLQKLRSLDLMRDQALERNSGKQAIALEDTKDIVLRLWERDGFGRIVIGIGGFPASGKTMGSKSVVRYINDFHRANLAARLPMDGFHFSNSRLAAEGLQRTKGDVTTYDVTSYARMLVDYKQQLGSPLLAPDYIRQRHDVFENQIEISPQIRVLVTEGIYVGYEADGWAEVSGLLDILFYLDASPEQCADRIISRDLEAGRSESMIETKLSNDFRFMETSIQILDHADFIIKPSQDPSAEGPCSP